MNFDPTSKSPGAMSSLPPAPEILDLPDAEVVFYPRFFSAADADRLLKELRETTEWRQDTMPIFGKEVPLPRLTAWYGDPGCRYVYSGIENEPLPWTPAILEVKRAVEASASVVFNGVLMNRYRTGQDSMGWHSDNEPELLTGCTRSRRQQSRPKSG
jgi:alkylated DNA repair dioxygenase AlkB